MSHIGSIGSTTPFTPPSGIQTLTGGGVAVSPSSAGTISFIGVGITVTGSATANSITLTGSGGASITFDADTGAANPVSSIININGTATQGISSAASGNTITLTISSATTSQIGVLALASNAQTVAGTNTTNAVTPASLAMKLGLQTAHGVAIGEGTSNALSWIGLNSGQVLIGSTGNDPAAAYLTAGAGIAITSAAGSITIASTGSVSTTVYTEDSGTATANGSGILNINGSSIQGIVTSGSGNTITVTAQSATTTQNGVVSLATNAQALAGTNSTAANTPASLSAKLGTQTAHAVAIGESSSSALSWIGLNSGQVLIGNTGNDPAAAFLTAGTGIVITSGAGSITISSTGASATTYVEDSGTATASTLNFLNINGSSIQGIVTSGSGNTITVTAQSATTTQNGVVSLSTNAQTIAGTNTTTATTPAALAAKLGTQTVHAVAIGESSSSALSWIGLNSGQVLIGNTGNDPAAAFLTAGTGIVITSGAGSITISSTGASATTYVEDSGTATASTLNFLNINGSAIQGIVTSGSGNVITITAQSATTTQNGVVSLATNAQAITGTNSTAANTPASLSAKLGDQTAHTIAIGEGPGGTLTWLGLSVGQVLIGTHTTADPVAANLSAGTGITITNQPGGIIVSAIGTSTAQIAFTYVTDTGFAVPTASVINFLGNGAQGIITSGNGNNTISLLVSSASTSQPGVALLATSAQTIAGINSTAANTPASLAAKLGTQTAHAVAIGESASGSLSWIGLNSGQVLIGNTGNDPAAAYLTAGAGVLITTGNGSIMISTASTASTIYTEDSGTAAPNGSGILNLNGSAIQGIVTSGFGNTITVTAQSATTTQNGVVSLATNAQALAGTNSTAANTPASLSAKLGTQTAHAVAIGESSSSALSWIGLNSGQVLIGNTGNDPAAAFLTAGSGIVITTGAGSITIASTGATTMVYVEDSGTATASTLNFLNINGSAIQGIVTSGLGNTITVTAQSATMTQNGVVSLSTNAQTIAGTNTTTANTPASLSAKLGTQTAHAVAIGESSSSALSWIGLNSGQVLIGNTGNDPAAAFLTAGSGIVITTGAGSITIASTGASATTYVEDSGTATASTLNFLNINGSAIQGIVTSGLGNTITVTAQSATMTQNGVVSLATNAQALTGTNSTAANTPASLSAKLGVQTAHGLPIGEGSTQSFNWTGAPLAGQVLIGFGTTGDPALNFLSAGSGITVINTPNAITIASTTSGGVSWMTITASTTGAAGIGYICVSGGPVVTLPASPTVGNLISVGRTGSTATTVTAPAGTVIQYGDLLTASGGSLLSTQTGDIVNLVFAGNATGTPTWLVYAAQGVWGVM